MSSSSSRSSRQKRREARRPGTLTLGGLAARQMRARWTSYVPTAIGLAAALALAVAVTLTHTRSQDASLVQTVSGLGRQGLTTVRLTGVRQQSDYERFRSDVHRAAGNLNGVITERSSLLYSGPWEPFTINGSRAAINGVAQSPQVVVMEDLQNHADLTAGSWPSVPKNGDVLQVTLPEQAAGPTGLTVGDTACIKPLSPPPTQYRVCMRITGIWKERNPTDAYWGPDPIPIAAFTDDATFFDNLKAQEAVDNQINVVSVATVTLSPNVDAIRIAGADASLSQLRRLHADFGVARPDAVVVSNLEDALDNYVKQSAIASFAIELVAVQLLLIALYCVWFLAGLLLGQQRRVISVWRSRGWSWQGLTLLLSIELVVTAIVATPLGIGGGWAIADITARLVYAGQAVPPIHLEFSRLTPPVVAVLLVEFGLLVARAMLAARHGVLRAREAESRPQVPWWRQRYVDLALALLAIPVLAEINVVGNASVRAAGAVSNPVTLALLGVAIALVALAALRLLPLVATLFARAPGSIASRLASMQLRRAPGQHAGLAILLMLAVAVGIFGSAYISTTRRNVSDRAAYQIGSDVRGTFGGAVSAVPDEVPLSGAAARSSVFRGYAREANEDVQMLAVDPYTFPHVMFTRDDLASTPLTELVQRLADKETGGLLLPADSSSLAIWVHGSNTGGTLVAHLSDEHGRPIHAELGALDFTGWKQLGGQLVADSGARSGQLRFRDMAISGVKTPGEIAFSSLNDGSKLVDSLGEFVPLGQGIYWVMDYLWWRTNWDTGSLAEGLPPSNDIARGDRWTIHFRVAPAKIPTYIRPPAKHLDESFFPVPPSTQPGPPVINPPTPEPGMSTVPPGDIPAIISSGLASRFGLSIGKTMDLNIDHVAVKAEVVGVAEHFPTLYPELGDFLVLPRDPVMIALAYGQHQRPWANEIWARAAPGGMDAAVNAMLEAPGVVAVLDRGALETAAAHSPYQLELQSNLVLGFAAAIVLALLAFILHFLVLGRGRLSDYAVLEANGMPQRLVRRSLLLEQGLLVTFCIVCGTVLGLVASVAVLPSLQLGVSVSDNFPPTIVTVDSNLIGVVLATILAASIIAGAAIATAIERPRIMSELRTFG